jgi:hypothetical protein
MHLDFSVQKQLHATTMDVQPSLLKRDAGKIRRVEQAADLAAVLDLTPAAGGLAEYVWLERMTELGPSAAPEIVARGCTAIGCARGGSHARASRSGSSTLCGGSGTLEPRR